MQKVDLPPSEDPLPGPICRNKNTTKCKAHSNPYLNGNLQMLSRKELYAMSYESSPNNPYKKPKTGPVVKCADVSDCKHLGKLCVDGQCVCPVMYSGSYDCAVETKPRRCCIIYWATERPPRTSDKGRGSRHTKV